MQKGANRKGGKKGRKIGRNYRLSGDSRRSGEVTRYRAKHGIPKGYRRDNHKQGICPLHN